MEQRKEALDEKDRVMEMVVPSLMDSMSKAFEEQQNQPFQYVVAYYTAKDDKLLGYHADSFCSLVSDKLEGKRYNGENAASQLAVIRQNLDTILGATEEFPGFGGIALSVKKSYFNNMTKEDIWIQAEYLDEGIAPQKFKWEII